MIAERYRISSSKRGVSPKKKKSEPPTTPKVVKPRPAWDSFLLVHKDAYKLTPKEALRKKNILVSENNVFIKDNNVSVGYRPVSALRERHPNIISPEKCASPAPKKEKKESDALDLIMSAKEKEVGRSVAQKSPAKMRGTSSFAPPVKTTHKPKTPTSKQSPGEVQQTEQDELSEVDDNMSIHEFDLSTKLFGHSSREINHTVSNVVRDNHQRLLHEKTAQLSQAFSETSPITFKAHKDTVSSSQAAKSLRTPSPQKNPRSAKVNTPNGDLNSSTHTTSTKLNASRNGAKVSTPSAEKDHDLIYVADEIRSLFSELKYYEELSGRRSILDTREELEEMMQDEAILNPESHKPVMRYLVQLVCQSMTYLLKSEVDLQEERSRYESLNAKFETLNALLSEDSMIPGVAAIRNGGLHSSGGGSSSGGGAEYGAGADVYGGADGGIAYAENDLYQSQFMSPARDNAQYSTATTPYATTNTTINNTIHATTMHNANTNSSGGSRHEAPSPSLKMIAQQYANDDLYPIPLDSEHSIHYDDYDYEASFVVSDVQNTPTHSSHAGIANRTANTTNTINTTNTPTVHGAQVTSTPARFHDKMATLTNPEHRANKLAMNAPPNMILSTPVRSVHGSVHSSVYGGSSSNHNASGVSSTAATPQIMPYNTNLAANHARDYTALGVYSTNTTPSANNTSNGDYYTQLSSPAVYMDAYSSYLPSAPAGGKAHGQHSTSYSGGGNGGNGGHGDDSGDVCILATPKRQNGAAHDMVQAGLERVDELIRYSRSIGNGNVASATIGTPGSQSHGDEYSTIARLTEHKFHPDHSMYDRDTSMYSVPGMMGAHGTNSAHANDTSVNSADATPARVRPQTQYTHLSGSIESSLPPPPPTSHYANANTNASTSTSGGSGGLYVRQPAQASAAQAQLLHTMHPTNSNKTTHTNNANANYVSSNDSVQSVQSTGSMQGMSGTSASDWLFGAYPTTTSSTSASKVGKGVMVGKSIGSAGSAGATPETRYVPPTTTMHTLPTTPYTTANTTSYTTTSADLTTPTREVVRPSGANTRTPATVDMYNTSTYNNTHTNNTSGVNNSLAQFNTTTPPLTAAIPSYLLNSQENSKKEKAAGGLVQVKSTTRFASPNKGSKASRIPLKASEGATIIVPSAAPSPHSKPVHPFAATSTPPASSGNTAMLHKLHSLQQHYTEYTASSSTDYSTGYNSSYHNTSNATTPTLTLEPWQTVQQRVYDARNGSF